MSVIAGVRMGFLAVVLGAIAAIPFHRDPLVGIGLTTALGMSGVKVVSYRAELYGGVWADLGGV